MTTSATSAVVRFYVREYVLHVEALLALAEDTAQRRHTFRDLHRVRRLGVVHYARHHTLRPHPPIKPNRRRIHRRTR